MLRTRVHRDRRPLLPFFTEGRPTATATTRTAAKRATPPVAARATSAPATPTPPPVVLSDENKGKLRGVYGSIYRSQRGTTKTKQEKVIREEAFTNDQFTSAWYQFCSVIPQFPDLHFLFKQVPTLEEGNKITLCTPNRVAEERMKDLMPLLKKHLGDKLQNDTLQISMIVKADHTLDGSPQEKLKLMEEKNKFLKNLIDDWKLRLN